MEEILHLFVHVQVLASLTVRFGAVPLQGFAAAGDSFVRIKSLLSKAQHVSRLSIVHNALHLWANANLLSVRTQLQPVKDASVLDSFQAFQHLR